MATGFGIPGRLPDAYTSAGTSSFTEFLTMAAPDLLPGRRPLPPGAEQLAPHGTTVVALVCVDGVVMAGDRRGTMGNLISNREMEKVHAADAHSLIGVAGTAGVAMEMVRLFQVELEHYEKLEGTTLSLHGKANKLSNMIRGNLAAAMQGLAAVPLFAGFDTDATDPATAGRIFSYDVIGGCSEEQGFHALGSGSVFARGALKKRYRKDVSVEEAARMAVEALYDAADEDSATGGPDLSRRIYPTLLTATAEGSRRFTDDEASDIARAVVAGRLENPGG